MCYGIIFQKVNSYNNIGYNVGIKSSSSNVEEYQPHRQQSIIWSTLAMAN